MKYSKKTFFSLMIALLSVSSIAWSQKFAHINSQQLLMESPKVKAADAQLETFQSQLIKKGQAMVTAFENDYKTFVTAAESKQLSPLQIQQKETALTAKQQEIQKFEVEVQQKLAMKRENLYKPILDEVKTAIDGIGNDGGYTMIFDTATNGLLFVEDSESILAQVKAKLGW
ncbi:MAG: OmpH family outer membrane protein [Saprospiraceae bacterium]